jgi:hypothetical protein
MLRLALVLPFLFSAACSTLNENQCRVGDWDAYGKVDGQHGYPAEYLREHEAACVSYGVVPDKARYETGRKQGLVDYCTPDSGYRAGRAGESYFGVCDDQGQLAVEFKERFALGQKRYRLLEAKREAAQALEDLDQKEMQENPNKGVGTTLLDGLGLSNYGMRRNSLTSQQAQLDREILASGAREPANGAVFSAYQSPSTVSDGLGAFSGTIVGFGSGHLFQGRYLEKGWLFTVSEAAALAALIALPNTCRSAETCRAFAATVPLVAFLGAKLWEAVDVWQWVGWKMEGYPHLKGT